MICVCDLWMVTLISITKRERKKAFFACSFNLNLYIHIDAGEIQNYFSHSLNSALEYIHTHVLLPINNNNMLDLSCCVALVLIIARDVFDIVRMSGTSRFWSRGTTDVVNNDGTTAKFSFQDLGDLNPDYIRDRFAFDNEQRGIVDLSIMLNAIATMAFFVPILQVAWILSDGGKRRVASQALVLIMALAGGMCELIVSLMSLGIRSTVIGWFGNSDFFNLENWIEEDSGDMIGWRVLELVYTIMRGKFILCAKIYNIKIVSLSTKT